MKQTDAHIRRIPTYGPPKCPIATCSFSASNDLRRQRQARPTYRRRCALGSACPALRRGGVCGGWLHDDEWTSCKVPYLMLPRTRSGPSPKKSCLWISSLVHPFLRFLCQRLVDSSIRFLCQTASQRLDGVLGSSSRRREGVLSTRWRSKCRYVSSRFLQHICTWSINLGVVLSI